MSKDRLKEVKSNEENEVNLSLITLTQEEYITRSEIFEQIEGETGFLRTEWPKVYEDLEYAGWMNTPSEPTQRFILMQGPVISAHAAVLERDVEIGGVHVRIAGLGGMIVRQEERSKGYGSKVSKSASAWITINAQERDLDMALLICDPSLIPFYEKFGWTVLPQSQEIKYGITEETSHSMQAGQVTMAIYLSEKATNSQADIERYNSYLGKPF